MVDNTYRSIIGRLRYHAASINIVIQYLFTYETHRHTESKQTDFSFSN